MQLIRFSKPIAMAEVRNISPTISVDPVQLPLVSSPWPPMMILAAYLFFVLKLGRMIMENREPLNLQGVIKVYNMVQVIYNSLLLLGGLYFLTVLKAYDLGCIHSLPLDHEHKNWEHLLSYLYYLNKYLDLTDTVFFVMRKKYRHISFLHVFHHTIMCGGGYVIYRSCGPGGILFPLCLLNTFVHIVMYSYYYLSSVSAEVQASLWWKKYITTVQLVQFILGLTYFANILRQPSCDAPRTVIFFCMSVTASFTILFANFYIRAYILPSKKKSQLKVQ